MKVAGGGGAGTGVVGYYGLPSWMPVPSDSLFAGILLYDDRVPNPKYLVSSFSVRGKAAAPYPDLHPELPFGTDVSNLHQVA